MGLQRDLCLVGTTAILFGGLSLLLRPGGSAFELRTTLTAGASDDQAGGVERDDLRQAVEVHDAAIAALSERLDRVEQASPIEPAPPHDLILDHGADGETTEFAAVVAEALASCDLDLERADIDCSESPCIAVLDGVRWDDVGRLPHCKAWARRYGTTVSMWSGHVTCNDAKKRPLQLVSPWFPSPDISEAREARSRRLRARWASLQDQVCAFHDGQPQPSPDEAMPPSEADSDQDEPTDDGFRVEFGIELHN